MSKKHLTPIIIVSSVISLIGLIFIFCSTSFGFSLADSWLMKRGEADTTTYHMIINGYINSFLVIGGILSSLGIIILTFTYFKIKNV